MMKKRPATRPRKTAKKKSFPLFEQKNKPAPIQMQITIPSGGVEIKLRNKFGKGTLTILEDGIMFDPPKAKIKSNRVITWEKLHGLARSGLL